MSYIKSFLSSRNIEYLWKTFCYMLCKKESGCKCSIADKTCYTWLLYANVQDFCIFITMTRAMPKPFSLEVMDYLESKNLVSGSSDCCYWTWLLVFKHTTLGVHPALCCLLFTQKEKKEKEIHLVWNCLKSGAGIVYLHGLQSE